LGDQDDEEDTFSASFWCTGGVQGGFSWLKSEGHTADIFPEALRFDSASLSSCAALSCSLDGVSVWGLFLPLGGRPTSCIGGAADFGSIPPGRRTPFIAADTRLLASSSFSIWFMVF